jgi:hypothetical protein
MSYKLNPRELRLLQESGMDWGTAKRITKMIKRVFEGSEVIAVTKTEPPPIDTKNVRVFPVKTGKSEPVYVSASKGGMPLKKKLSQPKSSSELDSPAV